MVKQEQLAMKDITNIVLSVQKITGKSKRFSLELLEMPQNLHFNKSKSDYM